MVHLKKIARVLLSLFALPLAAAAPNNVQVAVWANEAIVETYTFDYKNFLPRQKEIAQYFTADGWTAYSEALMASGLPQSVAKNAYFVTSVAQLPPRVKSLGENQWQAVMPLLVVYQNPQYQQKQSLEVRIRFKQVPEGQGVRGLSIESLQSKVIEPACVCTPSSLKTNANDAPAPKNAGPEKTTTKP